MKPARSDRDKEDVSRRHGDDLAVGRRDGRDGGVELVLCQGEDCDRECVPCQPGDNRQQKRRCDGEQRGHGMQRIVATSVRIEPFWSAKRCLTKFS